MQVNKLKDSIDQYAIHIARQRYLEEDFKWAAQFNFQHQWDIEAADFAAMYDSALQSKTTKRLWKDGDYVPKDMMLKMVSTQPDFARNMFRDLFNEEKSIDNRIARFKFCSDELLREYRRAKKVTIENNHYHEDNHMVFLYLAFQFPTQYTLFNFPVFGRAMERLGTVNLPGPHDLIRFVKISRTIFKFLREHPTLTSAFNQLLDAQQYTTGESMLMVQDFYQFLNR